MGSEEEAKMINTPPDWSITDRRLDVRWNQRWSTGFIFIKSQITAKLKDKEVTININVSTVESRTSRKTYHEDENGKRKVENAQEKCDISRAGRVICLNSKVNKKNVYSPTYCPYRGDKAVHEGRGDVSPLPCVPAGGFRNGEFSDPKVDKSEERVGPPGGKHHCT